MDSKRILELVADVTVWRGDVYRLAVIIAEEQREDAAQVAEAAERPDIAEKIRGM